MVWAFALIYALYWTCATIVTLINLFQGEAFENTNLEIILTYLLVLGAPAFIWDSVTVFYEGISGELSSDEAKRIYEEERSRDAKHKEAEAIEKYHDIIDETEREAAKEERIEAEIRAEIEAKIEAEKEAEREAEKEAEAEASKKPAKEDKTAVNGDDDDYVDHKEMIDDIADKAEEIADKIPWKPWYAF